MPIYKAFDTAFDNNKDATVINPTVLFLFLRSKILFSVLTENKDLWMVSMALSTLNAFNKHRDYS